MVVLRLTPASRLSEVRDAVASVAARSSCPDWPLTLVVTELLANAMAISPPGKQIELRVSCDHSSSQVTVVDDGPGLSADHLTEKLAAPPSAGQLGGRGLFLVGQLADDVRVERSSGRTVVSVRLGPFGGG